VIVFAYWFPALAVFAATRWLTGKLVGARPALWPRDGAFWKRLAVAVGGSLGCVMVVVLTLLGANLVVGTPTVDPRPSVVETAAGSPASLAGIEVGDVILSVDKMPTSETAILIERIKAAGDQPISLVVQRGDTTRTFTVTPVGKRIGVKLDEGTVLSHDAGQAWKSASEAPLRMLARLARALIPQPRTGFGGPVGIVQQQQPVPPSLATHAVILALAWQLMLVAVFGQLVALVLLCIPRRKTT